MVVLHSLDSTSILSLDMSVSAVFTARLSDLVFSARVLRTLRDFSLDSRREEAVEESEGRREGRSRDCQEVRAVWRGAKSVAIIVAWIWMVLLFDSPLDSQDGCGSHGRRCPLPFLFGVLVL